MEVFRSVAMTQPEQRRGFHIAGTRHAAPRLAAGLYLVATPIGNLGDITLRALETLAAADLISCEDTRVSRKLMDHYGIETALTPYHEYNAAAARPKLLGRIADGAAIALISDAGTPLISDPGFKLVREAREANLLVTALPGASSVLTALVASGLPTDRFLFEGFLPAKATQRRARIAELVRIPASVVLFEGGSRIAESLADLAAAFGEREAAICRELTKLHEEVRRERLTVLAAHYAGDAETRGEFVIVIAPPEDESQPAADDVDALIRAALERVSVKDAVGEIVAATGLPRRDVYQRALELAKERNDAP
jgi:16S rRNA (cytidine1402-2'-O)-methyltransferase